MTKIRRFHWIPPTLLLALSSLFSSALGVIRDHLLAKTFGAGTGEGVYNLDVYYAAFRIPDLLYNLLIFGAVSAAFIPIFTQYNQKKEHEKAWKFASSMFHLMLLGILVISAVTYVLAPYVVHMVAGGLVAGDIELTVKMMRILLLSPILFSFSAVLISLQDSFKCFFFRSLGPLFYNVGIIAGIVWWGEKLGVEGVTWGVIVGAVLQLLVQLPALKQIHYKHFWILGHKRKDIREAFKLMVPRVLGLSLNQATLLINTLIASFLMTGSITIFYLANNLQTFPLALVGISYAITSFALLSEFAAEPTTKGFTRAISDVLHQVLFLILPATMGVYLLRHEIIDVIFVGGKFSAADAVLTAEVMSFLLISLFAQALIPTLARGFYAYHNTVIPLIAAGAGMLMNVGFSFILALGLEMGITGIAIAFTIGNITNFGLLIIKMNQMLKVNVLKWRNIFKMLLATMVMGLAVWWTNGQLVFEGSMLQKAGLLLMPTGVGVMVYFVLAWGLRMAEFKRLMRR